MQKLLKTKKLYWFIFSFIFLLLISIIIFCIFWKVEKSIVVKLEVGSNGASFFVNSNVINILKKYQKINVVINEQIYNFDIDHINWSSSKQMFEIFIKNNWNFFLPHSNLMARIIYTKIPLWKLCIN